MVITTEQEDLIIRERITTSEANYKRLLKLCMTLVAETHSTTDAISSSRTSLDSELDSFLNMLNQMQLQLNMNDEESSKYEEQKRQSSIRAQELTEKSVRLQEKLAVAQVIRAQKEECSAMVDSMVKAKKVMLDEGGKKVPIIALLDSSRAENEKLNESLLEEVSELEAQKAKYQALWDSRRSGFDELAGAIDEFKTDILKRVKGGVDREGQETRDATTPFEEEEEGGGGYSQMASAVATPAPADEEDVDVEMALEH